jgi:glycosyltransferase involved in cell wall biosynthesis
VGSFWRQFYIKNMQTKVLSKYPKVSVIVPNYNHSLYLKERIDSILNQTYQNFELILLDDCSTDNSRDILDNYASHPKVSGVYLNDKNSGNTFLQWAKGIALAKGEYIWLAESDDYADSSFLQETVGLIDAHPNAVMCLTGSKAVDKNSKILRKDFDKWKETSEFKIFNGIDYIGHNLAYRNSVYNASMVIFRKNASQNLDHLFQQLKYSGDWLFWIELAQYGDVIEVRKKLNYFRQHPNKVTFRGRKNGMSLSNDIKVYEYLFYKIKFSLYKKQIMRGYLYKHIRRSGVDDASRNKLYQQADRDIHATFKSYYYERINKILAIFPIFPSYKNDKYK